MSVGQRRAGHAGLRLVELANDLSDGSDTRAAVTRGLAERLAVLEQLDEIANPEHRGVFQGAADPRQVEEAVRRAAGCRRPASP